MTARVGVRIDDFRAYMKQAIEGNVAIGKGLFAQAATDQEQQTNADDVFIDRVMKPIEESIGAKLTVSAPQKASIRTEDVECYHSGRGVNATCPPNFDHWRQSHYRDGDSVYRFTVTVVTEGDQLTSLSKVSKTVANNQCPTVDLRGKQVSQYMSVSPETTIASELFKAFPDAAHDGQLIQMDEATQGTRSLRRYAVVLLRTSDTPIAQACLKALSAPAKYEEQKSRFVLNGYEISILRRDGNVLERYEFLPYDGNGRHHLGRRV